MSEAMVHLGSKAAIQEKTNLWFSNFNFNGLFKMDLCTGDVEFVHRFALVANDKVGIHSAAYKCGEELIFIPVSGNEIITYNISRKKEYGIQIPDMTPDDSGVVAYKRKDKIWLFPIANIRKVFCYDIKERTIEEDMALSGILSDYAANEENMIGVSVHENILLIYLRGRNTICRVNLESLEVQYHELAIDNGKIYKVAYDGMEYWVLLENSWEVYKWNKQADTYEKYVPDEEIWIGNNKILPYGDICFVDSEVVLMSYNAFHVMKIDREQGKVEKAFDYPDDFRVINELSWGGVWGASVVYGDKLCLVPHRGSHVLFYDSQSREVKAAELIAEKSKISYLDEVVQARIQKDMLVETKEVFSLEEYMRIIESQGDKKHANTEVGEKIYQSLKRLF